MISQNYGIIKQFIPSICFDTKTRKAVFKNRKLTNYNQEIFNPYFRYKRKNGKAWHPNNNIERLDKASTKLKVHDVSFGVPAHFKGSVLMICWKRDRSH